VFVRPRFLPLSSARSDGIGTLELESIGEAIRGAGGGGRVVPGGRVLSFGLCEALRFRGFEDVVGGGARDRLERGGVRVDASGRASGTATDAVVFDAFDFCRLCGGGVLPRLSTCGQMS
jgi:hypothetical protein